MNVYEIKHEQKTKKCKSQFSKKKKKKKGNYLKDAITVLSGYRANSNAEL